MVGMADGYAQASGRVDAREPAHGARRRQRASAAIFNAQANKSPLLVTAGQQVRALITMQANLTNRDADRRAAAVRQVEPRAAARAGRAVRAGAGDPPRLAAAARARVRVDPDGRLGAGGRRRDATHTARAHGSTAARSPTPRSVAALAAAPRATPRNPVLVAGPDIDASRRLGRRGRARRAPAAGRCWASPADRRRPDRLPREPPGLPGNAAAGGRPGRRDARRATTSCSSSAPRCSPTTRTSPARFFAEGTELVAITCDPDEAARAPMGEAIVADVALTLRALLDERSASSGREQPPAPRGEPGPPAGERAVGRPRRMRRSPRLFPEDGIVVLESPSSTAALRNRLRLSRPGTYYFSASGGLGFGLSARRRRAARPARAPGRVRARRGLGAVRDHRALDGRRVQACRSRSSCCATRST